MNLIGTAKSYHRRWQRFNADFLEKNPSEGIPWRMISSLVLLIGHQYYFQINHKKLPLKEQWLISRENPIYLSVLSTWSLGEVAWFCLKKISRFFKYLNHSIAPESPDCTKTIDILKARSLDEPSHLWNQLNVKGTDNREITLFIHNEQLILIQDKKVSCPSSTWEDIHPFQWRECYERLVADSAVYISDDEDPLRAYISREFSGYEIADVDNVADMIYSYLSGWAISNAHKVRGVDLVTVSHREDYLTNSRLFSAMILGIVLKSIENIEVLEAHSEWKKRLTYDRLLEAVDSSGWRANSLCEYLREDLPQITELDPYDIAYAVECEFKKSENINEFMSTELIGMIGIAREFYLGYWPELSWDSPYKTKVAWILGRLDASYWYLKTVEHYPLNNERHRLTGRCTWKEIYGKAIESDVKELNWLKSETIKVFHLNPDLNLSKATVYYWTRIINGAAGGRNPTQVDLSIIYRDFENGFFLARHPVSNEVGLPILRMFLSCESKPDADGNMVENWLSQISGYLMTKSLCGESTERSEWSIGTCLERNMGACLLTLQSDICLQRAEITRRWDFWFYHQVTKHLLEASTGNPNPAKENVPELDYIADSLTILAKNRSSMFLFAAVMGVDDCMKMLKGFKYPSYVHVLMAFHWVDFIIDTRRNTNLVPVEVSSRTRDNIKSIFDRVKHYHFPNDYYKNVTDLDREYRILDMPGSNSIFTSTRDVFQTNDDIPDLYLNRTKYVRENSYGGVLNSNQDEEKVWERLLDALSEKGRGVLGSMEAKECLVKSLAYSCLRHSLTAHVCYVAGKRIARGETLVDYGLNPDGDEFTSVAMATHPRRVTDISEGSWVYPYFTQDHDLDCSPRDDVKLWGVIDSLAGFRSSDGKSVCGEVKVNHLDVNHLEIDGPWYDISAQEATLDI